MVDRRAKLKAAIGTREGAAQRLAGAEDALGRASSVLAEAETDLGPMVMSRRWKQPSAVRASLRGPRKEALAQCHH
jgi:hypothetical protein